MRLFLILLFATPLYAEDRIPGEWIVRPVIEGILPRSAVPLPNGYALIRSETMPVAAEWESVQPNYLYRAVGTPDPDFDKSWGLNNYGQPVDTLAAGNAGIDVSALKAWAVHGGTGSEIVAVIDSGVDLNHEDLKSNLWVNDGEIAGNGLDDDGDGFVDDRNGWNFADGNSDVTDKNGHGTFVAGIIGAAGENGKGTRGVNGRVRVLPIRFLDNAGVGSTASAIRSIEYAVARGAKVINASWGGTEYDPALYDSVKLAGEKGALFVAAAGNNGKNNDTDKNPIYPASFRLPALVTVAAYDNKDSLVSFSNYGKETVHLGAPGVAIYSTAPGGYRFGEGTSFAAPFVAGGAALLRSFVPGLGGRELKERLLATTDVIHYYEKERLASGGRLNLYNLLRNIRPPRPASPTAWSKGNQSGGTPHPYVNSQPYRLTVEQPGATHVRVHFKGFTTEGCCDRVVLKDKSLRVVAVYSGKLGDFWSADALGDTLTIEFAPDYSVSDFGFDVDAFEWTEEATLWSLIEQTGAQPPPYGYGSAGRRASPLGFGKTGPQSKLQERLIR